jgi:hypothetical protein
MGLGRQGLFAIQFYWGENWSCRDVDADQIPRCRRLSNSTSLQIHPADEDQCTWASRSYVSLRSLIEAGIVTPNLP